MFGRYVEIDGRKVFVFCTPKTPLSEVCRRAADQFARDEENERKGGEYALLYAKFAR